MSNYRPSEPFSTKMWLFAPQYVSAKGSAKKTFPETGEEINCSFKTYGGTEKVIDGVYVVEDTANVETWYRPDINSNCILGTTANYSTAEKYEIINAPENINMRNQFLKLKIQRVKGGA